MPIGVAFAHGFAVTTRLELLDEHEMPARDARWTSLHTAPAELRWLSRAQTVPLPRVGRYRAFLLTVTDLPSAAIPTAPVWNEQTVMAGPDIPSHVSEKDVPGALRLSPAHRLGVYVYVYERRDGEEHGKLVLHPQRRGPTSALLRPFAKGVGRHGRQ